MAKTLLKEGRHSSRRSRGYALTTVAAAMAVAAAISLLAAIPGSAQTTPCDNTDVVGAGTSNDGLRADCRALWRFYSQLSDKGTLDDAGDGQ